MKHYIIESAVITYIRPATDEEKAREAPVPTDAILVRDTVIDYKFSHSDILPDEYITLQYPDGTMTKLPKEGYCYTIYDIKRSKGWFWVAKEGVKEID